MIKKHELYSVMITDDKGKSGSGALFYIENSDYFYVFTCAHVIFTSDAVNIHILIRNGNSIAERVVRADKKNFYYSPIDEPSIIGENQSNHTCDIAVIKCEKEKLPLESTRYSFYPMSNGEKVVAVGYPQGYDPILYYQQETLHSEVLHILDDAEYFIIKVDERNVNSSDREAELKGYSGSPVWDELKLNDETYLLGGLISCGTGDNIIRGRVKVMNAKLLQNLMREEFGIKIDMKLPFVPDSDMAPGYDDEKHVLDQKVVRDSWVENERRKANTYINTLQLQKAVDVAKKAISNSEFDKCSKEQKYSIYAVLLEAYRLAREYDIYDAISKEMHEAGISSDREDLTSAVRYYEAADFENAKLFIEKALCKNPEGNEERIVHIAIAAALDTEADVSILSGVIGANDQLLIKPKDDSEEEAIYQILGYILGNRFKETGRAIRCLNRAYQIGGNPIILETLGIVYYFHSIRDAFIEEGTDKIDPFKIYRGEIDKARDALLRVFSYADEMWLKGTFRRAGLQIFKCFFFMRDNFRIYKHYKDVINYFEFPNAEIKRDIQISYLNTAVQRGCVNLDEFDAITEFDRKYYELVILLQGPMRQFNEGITVNANISEAELLKILSEAEKRLTVLKSSQIDNRLSLEGIHSTLINLYGNGILRYRWNAVSAVENHISGIKDNYSSEIFSIYLEELKTDDISKIERRYHDFFDIHKDIISYNEWIHFCIRHGMFDTAKALYESVFEDRKYLIEEQPEYFYRDYIDFMLHHGFDLKPAIQCFVNNRSEFKDPFIYLSFEMDLNFATVTFNDPDKMIEDAGILLNEGLYTQRDYDEKCLIINMLNCRPSFAEKYAAWAKGADPMGSSFAERILLVWKGAPVEQNPHWNSMKNKATNELVEKYKNEEWLRKPGEILDECNTSLNKTIVVDLWTLYLFTREELLYLFDAFRTIYVTHNTVSVALQEINQVADDTIRKVLIPLQIAKNVKFMSPTLEQQLEVRSSDYRFMEIHSACLLAKTLNCPALVGEYRFPIPKALQEKVIRPIDISAVMDCVAGRQEIEGQ